MAIQIKRILCPTDFSESAAHALTYATSFAQQYGATIYLLHVIEPITVVPALYLDPTMTYEDRPDLMETIGQLLNEAIPEEVRAKVEVKQMIRRGAPFLEIVRAAREESVDLIVIATHGRTGLAHVLLGSTAERVVRKAPCPVLTVKHPEHEFVMP
jgi:nucleotide-binding universal stress UspA family protein